MNQKKSCGTNIRTNNQKNVGKGKGVILLVLLIDPRFFESYPLNCEKDLK